MEDFLKDNNTAQILTEITTNQMRVFNGYDNAIKVYTVGDIIGYGNSIALNTTEAYNAIQLIVNKKDYYPATLRSYTDKLETYLLAINNIQQTVQTYRTVKTAVEGAVTIGGIIWNFAYVAKLAQDALQVIQKLAISTSKTVLSNTWKAFLALPAIAIYDESGEAVSEFSDTQDYLSDTLNKLVEDSLSSLSYFNNYYNIIKTTNDYIINNNINSFGYNLQSLTGILSNNSLECLSKNKLFVYDNNKVFLYTNNNETSEADEINLSDISSVTCDFDNDIFYYSIDNIVYEMSGNISTIKTTYSSAVTKLFHFNNNVFALLDNNLLYKEGSSVSLIQFTKVHCYDNYMIALNRTENTSTFYEYTPNILSNMFSVELPVNDFASLNGKLYCVVGDGESKTIKQIDKDFSFKNIDYNDSDINVTMVNSELSLLADNNTIYSYSLKGTEIEDAVVSLDPDNATEQELLDLVNSSNNSTVSYSEGEDLVVTTKITDSIENFSGITKINDMYIATSGSSLTYFKNSRSKNIYNKIGYLTTTKNNDIEEFYKSETYNDSLYNPFQVEYFYSFEDLSLSGIEKDDTGVFVISNNNIFYYEGETILEEVVETEVEDTVLSFFPTIKENYLPEENVIDYDYLYCTSMIHIDKFISCIKRINGIVYVGIYKPGATNNGVYKLYYDGEIKLELAKSSGVNKIFSFTIADNIWYLLTADGIFKDGVNEIEGIELDDDEVLIELFNSGISDKSISFFSNNRLKKGIEERKITKLNSFIDFSGDADYKIASSNNSIIIADDNYIYLGNKEKIGGRNFYQLIERYEDDVRLIGNKDNILLVVDNQLALPPNVNSDVKYYKFHNGYKTSGVPFARSGVASYFYMTNLLENHKYNTSRSFFINSLEEDFTEQFELLTDNIVPAITDFIYNKISEEIMADNNTITGDTSGELLSYLKNSLLASKKAEISLYITNAFSNLSNSKENKENFIKSLNSKLLKSNDLVEEFYGSYKELFDITIGTVSDTYLDYDINNYIITYFQDHKNEWSTEMQGLVEESFVSKDLIQSQLTGAEFWSWVNNIENEMNSRLITAKTGIDAIVLGKSGIISNEDKLAILEIIDNIDINPTIDGNILEWRTTIEDVVSSVYLPKQEELFELAINTADMEPIFWSELPIDINRVSFTTLLNLILQLIREEIISKIYYLVMEGKVKCYSCVDAKEISAKCYWELKQQLYSAKRLMKSNITRRLNTTYELFEARIPTLTFKTDEILSSILESQTELYATYINKIIETQINLSEDEVTS